MTVLSNPSDATIVFYHAHCTDGFGAAWSARRLLGDQAKYIAIGYEDPFPTDLNIDGQHIVCVDFSFKPEIHQMIVERAASFLVLDHHQTAEARYGDDDHCFFDQSKSGAVLAWEFFHPTQAVPPLLLYVQDVDLHRQALPYHAEMGKVLYEIVEHDFETWDDLHENFLQRLPVLVAQGEAVNRVLAREITRLQERAQQVTLGGLPLLAVNYSGQFHSTVANSLADLSESGVGAVWSWLPERRLWKVSLRSREDAPHVNQLAERFGGGGHPHAASFFLDRIQALIGD